MRRSVIITLPVQPRSASDAWDARVAALKAWDKAPTEETRAELIAATRHFLRAMDFDPVAARAHVDKVAAALHVPAESRAA